MLKKEGIVESDLSTQGGHYITESVGALFTQDEIEKGIEVGVFTGE